MQAQGVCDEIDLIDPNEIGEKRKDKMDMSNISQGIPEDMLLSITY